jgi:integrase
MDKLTTKKLDSLLTMKSAKHAVGDGLYFVVPRSGQAYWILRYTNFGKRREMTLGNYPDLSLKDARLAAATNAKLRRDGLDPLIAKQQAKQTQLVVVDDLFSDWQIGNKKRLKYPGIPDRVYRKDIAPEIGKLPITEVTPRHIQMLLRKITTSGRPSIANDALLYLKQIFNHGIKLDLTSHNPAAPFSVNDAGGVEASKDRALSLDEVKQAFKVFRENPDSFTRDNYLACALLICLGVRKSELTEAKWAEFNLDKAVWSLPKERSKTGVGMEIPLPPLVIEWLNELKGRAFNSEYVFPNRRSSKNGHMGPDTLNRAISKMFGQDPGKKVQPPNKMGDMPHFTVHDLRRTCRTLLAEIGVLGHVAERCLNHKLKGVEGIYNKHDYFEERREALTKLAEFVRLAIVVRIS